MRGCRAAAAAKIRCTSGDELCAPRGELLRPHGEDGSAVFQSWHTGVGQYADRNGAVLCESLDDGDELLRAERAVYADDVGAECFQGDGGRLRVSARDGAPVLAVRELADDGKACRIFCRQKACTHFLYVNARFKEQIVGARIGKRLCLLIKGLVGVLEFEIAERDDEAPRRP